MKKLWIVVLAILFVTSSPVYANQPLELAKVFVEANQSIVMPEVGVEKVAVANPEIADVVVVSSNETLVVGKKAGITTLHIWGLAGRKSYLVEVGQADGTIAEVREMIGYAGLTVKRVNRSLLLEGEVVDQNQRDRAERIAKAYGENVINLLKVSSPLQVMLEVKVVEVNTNDMNKLGIKWAGQMADDKPNPRKYALGNILFGQSRPNGGGFAPVEQILLQLDALIDEGKGKVLSQPNVVALSGAKANFLVGGQIPVPVSNQNGQISVEWKDYGVKLDFKPVVEDKQHINLEIKPEVSAIDWSNVIEVSSTVKIPAIKTRKAETNLVLKDGETFAIGGLLQREEMKQLYKIPLISDIPIIGKLFQSKQYTNGETELVIFVTPKIIHKT